MSPLSRGDTYLTIRPSARPNNACNFRRTVRRDSPPTLSRARRRISIDLRSSCRARKTSRAILLMRLRTTAPPAARPSDTTRHPVGSVPGATNTVHEPLDARAPLRRNLPTRAARRLMNYTRQTVSRYRPLARRRLRTFRPSGVLIRFIKPCEALRLLRFG